MTLPGPLRAELFKYRKRKGLSTHGNAGGIAPAQHAPAGSQDPALSIDLPHQHHDYDPIHAAYQQMAAEYEQPAAWFEGMHHQQNPEMRLDPLPREVIVHERVPGYDDGLVLDWVNESWFQAAFGESHEVITPLELQIAEPEPPLPGILGRAEQLFYDQGDFGPGYLELAASRQASQVGPAATDEAANLSSLEQIVEGELGPSAQMLDQPAGLEAILQEHEQADLAPGADAGMGPQPEPDPEEDPLKKQQQLYDLQLEQMLNPYMSLGLGGPFGPGPMMGPG